MNPRQKLQADNFIIDVRNAVREGLQRQITFRQIINNLFAGELSKPPAEQNGFALQCLEHLSNNLRLTPFELREFIQPAPGEENAEVLVYGAFNWGDRNGSFLTKILNIIRLQILNGSNDEDEDDDWINNPNIDAEIRRYPRNRHERRNRRSPARSRSRSRSRSPITFQRYTTALEIYIRNEIEQRVRSEVQRELEPRIRREFEVEYQMWREIDINNTIEAERRRKEEEDIRKLRAIAARSHIPNPQFTKIHHDCPFCLEPVFKNRPLSLKCGHFICLPCFLNIYDNNGHRLGTCLQCRQPLENVPHYIYL